MMLRISSSSPAVGSHARPSSQHHGRQGPAASSAGFRRALLSGKPALLAPRASGDAEKGEPAPASPGISEDVLARLKKAEEEAAALRQQLEAVQGSADAVPSSAPKRRIDSGGMKRETIFSDGKDASNDWLVESQAVDLLVGAGPGETGQGITEEGEKVVQRRLLFGGLATLGLGAFALVPTETFRPKPSKPLFFYLTAVVRVQSQLEALREPVADGQVEQITPVLSRMLGQPGDIRSNVENAIAWLDDNKTREEANALAQDFLEYLQQIDYSKYFENRKGAGGLSGDERLRYSEFSLKCIDAARGKLKLFLQLMPAEDLEAARSQANTGMFGS